jgi:hypothetical protein
MLLALATAACASSGSTPTGGPTLPAGAFMRTWSITATAPGGDVLTADLTVGDPRPYRRGIEVGGATAGAACALSPATDAVIPARLTVSGSMASFDTTVGIVISGIGGGSFPGRPGPQLLWEADYATGMQCVGQSDGSVSFEDYSNDPFSAGTTTTTDAFFDITGFYSAGDRVSVRASLGDAVLTVASTYTITTPPDYDTGSSPPTTWTVTNVSGPGVARTGTGWAFTLAGSAPPAGTTTGAAG